MGTPPTRPSDGSATATDGPAEQLAQEGSWTFPPTAKIGSDGPTRSLGMWSKAQPEPKNATQLSSPRLAIIDRRERFDRWLVVGLAEGMIDGPNNGRTCPKRAVLPPPALGSAIDGGNVERKRGDLRRVFCKIDTVNANGITGRHRRNGISNRRWQLPCEWSLRGDRYR
jgi:hypothetical protein